MLSIKDNLTWKMKWAPLCFYIIREKELQNYKNFICLKPSKKNYIDWLDCYIGDRSIDFWQFDQQLVLN